MFYNLGAVLFLSLSMLVIFFSYVLDTIHHTCTNDSDCVGTITECRATEDTNLKKCGCIIGSGYFPDDHGCFQAGK